jgi:hypothetical protein
MMRVMGWVVCAVLLLLSASLVMAQDETQLPFTVSESPPCMATANCCIVHAPPRVSGRP